MESSHVKRKQKAKKTLEGANGRLLKCLKMKSVNDKSTKKIKSDQTPLKIRYSLDRGEERSMTMCQQMKLFFNFCQSGPN